MRKKKSSFGTLTAGTLTARHVSSNKTAEITNRPSLFMNVISRIKTDYESSVTIVE